MASPHLIAALTPDQLSFYTGPPDVVPDQRPSVPGTAIVYSPDGSLLATWTASSVTVFQEDMTPLTSFEADNLITFMCFSPKSTYLVTYERPKKELGNAHRNLKLWDARTGKIVVTFHKRGISKENWPAIQFSPDEKHLFHLITDAVNVHSIADTFQKAVRKVVLKGMTAFSVCPGKRKVLACYAPEGKSQPACTQIMDWGDDGSMINRKSFFRSQCCAFQWNPQGTNVLITSSCDYDATNSSYFGEAKLYYMSADGKTDMIVPLDKDGSILDAKWSPLGDSFVAVYGTMPASATLFDDKCKPLAKLVTGPYNTVRFSPTGRFILLAGFGQLPGDIQLFERKGPKECTKMGGTKSECSVVCEWSPCSRYFMTACTAPRMRIDNRISVYTYYGVRVHQTEFKELLDASWRPAPREDFPDRGQSPERVKEISAAQRKGVDITVAAKAPKFVPPHQRGAQQEGGSTVEGFDADAAAARVKTLQKNLGKNRVCLGAEDLQAPKASRKRSAKKSGGADAAAAGVAALEVAPAAPAVAEDPQKRLRNLRKKLQKIQIAKDKQAKGDVLEPEQLANIAAEPAVLEEMRQLGADDV